MWSSERWNVGLEYCIEDLRYREGFLMFALPDTGPGLYTFQTCCRPLFAAQAEELILLLESRKGPISRKGKNFVDRHLLEPANCNNTVRISSCNQGA